MNSHFLKLNLNDLVKGAVTAVFTAFVVTLYGVVSQSGFDVFTADWSAILSTALNAGVAALIGYLGKNWLSDSEGKVLGRWG